MFVWAALVGVVTIPHMEIGDRSLPGDGTHRLQSLLAALGSGVRGHDLTSRICGRAGRRARHADHLHVRRVPKWIAIAIIVIGLILTLAPVVCGAGARPNAQGRQRFSSSSSSRRSSRSEQMRADLPQVVTQPRIPAEELGFAVLLGALAFAGAGGGQNLAKQLDPRQGLRHGQIRAAPQSRSPANGGHAEHGFVLSPPREPQRGRVVALPTPQLVSHHRDDHVTSLRHRVRTA